MPVTEKNSFKLYGGEIEIDFYPNSHRYKLKGRKDYLISATAVTGMLDKSRFLIPWAVNLAQTHMLQFAEAQQGKHITSEELTPVIYEACRMHEQKKEEAADIGDLVHKWIHQFALTKKSGGSLPEIPENEKAQRGINGFLDWYMSRNVRMRSPERLLYSKLYDHVGTTDLDADIDDIRTVVDWKTGKGVYPEFWLQLSSYWGAMEEEDKEKVERGILLHLNKETGEFTSHETTREEMREHYSTFLHLLEVKKWAKKNNSY